MTAAVTAPDLSAGAVPASECHCQGADSCSGIALYNWCLSDGYRRHGDGGGTGVGACDLVGGVLRAEREQI
jgi:hypothetical protein